VLNDLQLELIRLFVNVELFCQKSRYTDICFWYRLRSGSPNV